MKRTILKRIVAVVIVVTVLAGIGIYAVFAENDTTDPLFESQAQVLKQYLSDLTDDVVNRYKYDVTKEELLLNACKALMGNDVEKLKTAIGGVLNNLDEHSHFYTGDEYLQIRQAILGQGDQGILGLQMQARDDGYVVMNVVENMPADIAGIRIGDVLLRVDGVSVSGKTADELSELISGEPGSTVVLEIRRDGFEQPLSFTIERKTQVINPVVSEVIDGDITYIKLDSFNGYSNQFFQQAMDESDRRGIHNIILDLRDNGGGILEDAVGIASRFIEKGKPIVSLSFKDEKYNTEYVSQGLGKFNYNVVLLVNEYSASASEIVAGALKDYQKAYLIGRTTYGKGSVQQFSDLNGLNSAMNLTIAHYLTPNGTEINEVGIRPDEVVDNQIVSAKPEDFIKLTYETKPKLGDVSEQVLAINQRLLALGFDVDLTEEFNQKTYDAIFQFQAQTGLYPYGVADINTQSNLHTYAIWSKKEIDKQKEAAIAYFQKDRE